MRQLFYGVGIGLAILSCILGIASLTSRLAYRARGLSQDDQVVRYVDPELGVVCYSFQQQPYLACIRLENTNGEARPNPRQDAPKYRSS